jgi:hypothetical protein
MLVLTGRHLVGEQRVSITKLPTSERAPDDLVTIQELADALEIAESTAWLVARRLKLRRYRKPSSGKITYVSLSDAKRAYETPRAIDQA